MSKMNSVNKIYQRIFIIATNFTKFERYLLLFSVIIIIIIIIIKISLLFMANPKFLPFHYIRALRSV